MKTGRINMSSILNSQFRIDPSLHLSDGVKVRRNMASLPFGLSTLDCCSSKIFLGNIFSRVFVKSKDFGVTYLAASDAVLANIETEKYLSKKQASSLSYLKLQSDWILCTCSGTLGNITYTNKHFCDKIATHDLIRIVPDDQKYKRGCLYAFLSSKYGYFQITQSQFGGVVKHINAQQAGNILVPNFPSDFQERIDSLIQDSARLREEATDALNQAVDYFNKLYPIDCNLTKTFCLGVNNLKLGFAAYNNNLEVDAFVNQYKDKSYTLSSRAPKIFAPPLFKHIYLSKDNGYPFMTGSELTKYNLRYYKWLSPRGVKDINDYVVKKGTLLLYKSGTTDGGILGNTFIADKKLDGCCLSDHVIRISFTDDKEAYWAFAFLRSMGGVKMLQRLATGTMIPFITPDRVSNLLIPEHDDNYEYIVGLISKYIDLTSLSKEKEDTAITLVEKEIDKWNN